MQRLRDQAEMFRGRLLDLDIGLWTALTALDALLVSGAAVVSAFVPSSRRWAAFAIIGCCLVSIILTVWNFHSRRNGYRPLTTVPPLDVLSDPGKFRRVREDYRGQQDRTRQEHRWSNRRDIISYCLIATSVALIAVLICAAQG